METDDLRRALQGSLLGTAVGDAMGLCCEGLSRRRQARMFPNLDRPRFLFGRGMVSDDTEHACFVAQSLIVSRCDVGSFRSDLARRLRWWLVGLPAGIGLATLKSLLRLWIGISPQKSGVFSAGNGPAMRAPVLGIVAGDDDDLLRDLVATSTRITHSDPKALVGALAVALAARVAADGPPEPDRISGIFQEAARRFFGDVEDADVAKMLKLVDAAAASAKSGESTASFADLLGPADGVSGYMYHTVPVVLHAWFRHPADYRAGMMEIIRCGGDSDTTAAILGGIVGATVGGGGIPAEWREAICEWPRSLAWMERVADALAESLQSDSRVAAPTLPIPGLLLRNLAFALIVLTHGFRRLLPPW